MPEMKHCVHVTGPRAEDWHDGEMDCSLEGLQKAVGGGCIEALPLPSRQCTVFVNEEGKLRSDLMVTALWTGLGGELYDVIAGPLVILGPVDEEGGTTSLTNEALECAKRYLRPAIAEPEVRVIGWRRG